MTTRPYAIVIHRNPQGVDHLRLVAPNGEIVMGSENFSKPANASRSATRLQEAAKRGFVIRRDVPVAKPAKKVAALLKKGVKA